MTNFKKISIGKTVFFIQEARTIQEWTQGLSDVDTMKKSQGLLFCYGSSLHRTFWMKGMKFPLDVILFDVNGQVVEILKNLPPPTNNLILGLPKYKSKFPISYALEVNAGESDTVSLGDKLEFVRNVPK